MPVIVLNAVTKAYPGRVVLDEVDFQVDAGQRVGLVGANGAGKTSLLRLLAGVREPDAGVVKRGQTVRIAFLQQELEDLDGTQRVLESLVAIRPRIALADGRELTAGQLCERFGFTGDRQWTYVRDLSGGERRRLQLMRLLMGEPNVLLLDEPTNDLDTDTLAALEDLPELLAFWQFLRWRRSDASGMAAMAGIAVTLVVAQAILQSVPVLNHSVVSCVSATAARGDPSAVKRGSRNFPAPSRGASTARNGETERASTSLKSSGSKTRLNMCLLDRHGRAPAGAPGPRLVS